MSGFFPIFRRELFALWVTPLAWVLLTVFLFLQGLSFFQIVWHLSNLTDAQIDAGPVQSYFGQSIFLIISLLIVCPALTMRLFAEERRSGTLETLLTAPVDAAAVVLGKYLAALVTYVVMWAPTTLFVVILRNTGEVDWQIVGAAYLGIFAIGASYLAVGTLTSTLARSQLVALLLAVAVQFGLFVLGVGEYVFDPGFARDLCAHVSVFSQMDELSKGIVDSRRFVFDGTLTLLPLFFAVRVVESWRQG